MNVPAVKKSTFSWTTPDVNGMFGNRTKSFFISIRGLPEITCILVCNFRTREQNFTVELSWDDCQTTPVFYSSEINVYSCYERKNVWTFKQTGQEGVHISSAETFPKIDGKAHVAYGELRFDVVFEFNLFMSCDITTLTKMPEYATPLLNDGIFSDVTIICGDKTFCCHKVIIAGCSEVFKKMVTSPFREASENRIELKDMTDDVATPLIKFIYDNEVPEDSVTWALFEAAKLYDVRNLMHICVNILGKNINVDNSCEMLIQAHKHSLDDLFQYTLRFINRNRSEVATTEGWKDIITRDSEFISRIILAALEEPIFSGTTVEEVVLSEPEPEPDVF